MSPAPRLTARDCLPRDAADALLIGRAWVPALLPQNFAPNDIN